MIVDPGKTRTFFEAPNSIQYRGADFRAYLLDPAGERIDQRELEE
jgi:hypothetical protein